MCYMLKKHGQLYEVGEHIREKPPIHPYCRCVIKAITAIIAGYATEKGRNGADWWLKYQRKLPSYYVTEAEAKAKGFSHVLGNLGSVAPGMMYMGGVYKTEMVISPLHLGEYGMRQTSTIHEAIEAEKGSCFPTMD